MNLVSLNGKVVVEPYKSDRSIQTTVKNGFAKISQKITVVGLKVLMNAEAKNLYIQKGSTAFIKEELLHTQPWAKALFESEGIEGQYMIVDASFIEFIAYPQKEENKTDVAGAGGGGYGHSFAVGGASGTDGGIKG